KGAAWVAGAGANVQCWLKLVRVGDTFSSYWSDNGADWRLIGTANVLMTRSVYIGLAVTSHDNSVLNTSTFDNVAVSAP
ncbi:MAG: hypothetical protein ACRD68_10420, partial [Pyrinomonadaceae bacterium]